ncbi:MAG: hypothetical protein ACRC4N_07805, partial [Gammaproteobacteria bacterium]
MAAQTQMMYTMMNQMQAMNNNNSNNRQGGAPVTQGYQGPSKLAEFMRTRPPTFSGHVSPVEADDWLRVIERKLLITQCSDHEKVLYATHQMEGIAAEWWENFCAAHEAPQNITWEEFSAAFRQYHVPEGIMDLKKDEFRALKQGGMSVTDYLNKFSQLARYAPEDVATDRSRQNRFLKGLNSGLQVNLLAHTFPDFQELINKALVMEDKRKELEDHRKRRMAQQGSHQPQQQRARIVPQQFTRFQPQNSFRTPAPPSAPRPFVQNSRNPTPVNPTPGNNSRQDGTRVCFSCRQPGHYANQCPQKGTITPVRFNLGATPAKTPVQNNQGVSQGTSQPGGTPQSVVRGRVNHVTLEGAQEAPDVVLGKFLVNSVPASVLFDSGAS